MQTTIKSKLTLGLGFLFLIILLLSGVGGYFLYQLSRSTAATLQDNYRSVSYAQRMKSEDHTSELQSLAYLVCRLLLEKKKAHV